MTRDDDIIRMAREAGWSGIYTQWISGTEHKTLPIPVTMEELSRFANLVAAQEREACAKVAKETVCDMHLGAGIKIYGTKAAAAIRARGQA
jgi:hypothetical protein